MVLYGIRVKAYIARPCESFTVLRRVRNCQCYYYYYYYLQESHL